ncbi:hypothetical protein OHV05_12695 [Kitasatospora sp. NBC_00070]|uniref:hypothetical protein n=1 Tax=Kitasatospora sp. NBC_00070 TaxID=2975962 RepID=UPI0032439220
MHRSQDRTAELDAFIAFVAGLLTALLAALLLAGLNALVPVGPGLRQLGYGLIGVAGAAGLVLSYLRLRTR